MKPSLLCLLCAFITLSSSAQQPLAVQWQRSIGTPTDERFETVVNDPNNIITACTDGGYAVVLLRPSNPGTVCSSATWTGEQLFLIKFNKYGVTEWEKCYGGLSNNFWMYSSPGGLIQTADNGFLIVGGTSFNDGDFATNHGQFDGFAIKTSAAGVKEWSRCYGGGDAEGFSSVLQAPDGNFIVAGEARSNSGDVSGIHWLGSSGTDAWILKLSPTGSIIWQKCVDQSWGTERFSAVKKLNGGGYIAVGEITARISEAGSIVWQRVERSTDVAVDALDNIYSTQANPGPAQVRKEKADGTPVWARNLFPGLDGGAAISVQHVNDTTVMVAGSTNDRALLLNGFHWNGSFQVPNDIFFADMDSSGRLRWVNCIGGYDVDEPVNFIQTPDKGFLLLARSWSSSGDVLQNAGGADYWLAKIGNTNTISGRMFYDYNANGIQDAGEGPFNDVVVSSEKAGSINGMYVSDGRFRYTVDTGVLVTKPQIDRPYFTITPATLTTTRTGYGFTDSVTFAVSPTPGIKDLGVYLSSQAPQRPGFSNRLILVLGNHGTQLMQTATVGIRPDPKMQILSHDSTGFSRSGDTLLWTVSNMAPQTARTIVIYTRNPPPPALSIGDSLFHFVMALPYSNDSTDIDNRDTIRQNVVGSFDPNNKLDDVGGTFYNDRYKSGDRLLYMINFQNTGTDTAFTVVVRDTLSSSFTVSSLQVVGASHPYTLAVNGNRLQWTFTNIRLVDSLSNESKSHGYLMFRIRPKAGLPVGQVLSNRASIYFDYNLPVLTGRNDVKIVARPLASPAFGGLASSYCRRPGMVTGRLLNPPPAGSGVTIAVRLDATPLTVGADSTFSFDPGVLSVGSHSITATYTQGSVTTTTAWPFTVVAPGVLDLILTANPALVFNISQTVVITGSNATGGTNLHYIFARDRAFTNILQAESANNLLSLPATSLSAGLNTIYGRLLANGQCYTETSNTDSVAVILSGTTGIVDVDAPGQAIQAYPVPFRDELTVRGLVASRTYELRLLDMKGHVVLRTIVRNHLTGRLETGDLPAGGYLLQVRKDGRDLGGIPVVKR
ncbi:MAG: type sorting protein [Flaviaesturariibacter sp.]|nr:type sorting protein [Flaviaesturariibacter sp.]